MEDEDCAEVNGTSCSNKSETPLFYTKFIPREELF